jgi:hypothetical protein
MEFSSIKTLVAAEQSVCDISCREYAMNQWSVEHYLPVIESDFDKAAGMRPRKMGKA